MPSLKTNNSQHKRTKQGLSFANGYNDVATKLAMPLHWIEDEAEYIEGTMLERGEKRNLAVMAAIGIAAYLFLRR